MADAIVSFTIKKIGDLLKQEGLLYGVSEQVEKLQSELNYIQHFLKDADSKASSRDQRVCNWVAEIRDLVYDAEDVLETYALKVESMRRREGIMNVLKRFACILNEGTTLHKVGSEIEAITAKISNLTKSLQTYGIIDLQSGSSSSGHQRQPSYSHVEEPYIVGRDKSIDELVKHLVDDEKNYRLVSICGMGGLGKTTLARKVYHHAEVTRRFDYLAWSFISQPCKPRDAWEGILSKLINKPREKVAKLRDEELVEKLYQVQKEKRCLVILDDIWSTQDWDSLKAAFPREETSSKILLTTRNKDVALQAEPKGFHYEPQFLDVEESWELLQKIASADVTMEDLGKEMVKHCGGLPLAITVLGGLLATKHSSEWHTVHETIKSCLRRGKGHGQQQLGVLEVLALSYNDLPTELKPCFLYLSHFPEDYEIEVYRLIQLWVAEGIIKLEQHNSEEGEETMEDVAERYLNELAKRCMVLVGKRDASLRIETCRMHDLMRDLCLSKAKEENFFHIVNCGNGDENIDIFLSSSSVKIRRLAIYNFLKGIENPTDHLMTLFLKCIKNPDHLRTLLCFLEYEFDRTLSFEMTVFNKLKLLRALAVEGGDDMRVKLPKDIGKLLHLRFLSLRNYAELPTSLGNLRCLQTLDLRYPMGRVHIPNVLWKMKTLRHLYLPWKYDDETKLVLGNLRNLQTLVNFSLKNFDVSDLLNNMTNLRELKIQRLYLVKDFGETFKSRRITLNHLRSLAIYHCDPEVLEKIDVEQLLSGCINLCELKLLTPIEKLPDDHQLPKSITDISLHFIGVEEDPMATLKKLPNLRKLTLGSDSFIGKQMVCSGEGFPRLHTLRLYYMSNLEEWRVDEGALPNLCHLEITHCEKLKTFPDGLRFVKTLKELKIKMMPKEFKEKLVEGGEDFYKVQHVPSVIFNDCELY